jgi:hypothetical protein
MDRLRVLTWHVHGSYLESLGSIGHDILLPVRPGRPEGYGGRPTDANWPHTVREIDARDRAYISSTTHRVSTPRTRGTSSMTPPCCSST